MKNNTFPIVLFFMLMIFAFSVTSHAQTTVLKFGGSNIHTFAIDPVGAVYTISETDVVKKFDTNGDSVGIFNEAKRFGKLTSVVAENPWKVLLFYKNFSTIVILDKYLKRMNSLDLRKKNIYSVSAIATSYDNNIWLFDEEAKRLKKIDETGKLIMESEDFRVLFTEIPSPVKILDRDGFIYLYDPHYGLYVFDYYGSHKATLPFKNWFDFTTFKKIIYGSDNNNLYMNDLQTLQSQTFGLPFTVTNAQNIKLTNNMLYVLKENEIVAYSLESLSGKN